MCHGLPARALIHYHGLEGRLTFLQSVTGFQPVILARYRNPGRITGRIPVSLCAGHDQAAFPQQKLDRITISHVQC